jgi:hypothetical protein
MRPIIIGHRSHASAEESLEDEVEIGLDLVTPEQIHQALAAEHLAVDEHAVAIEDDQLVAQGRSQGGIRS